jgi:hypothetical protein
MIIKESKAQSDIYIRSELYNHPLNLLPSPLLQYKDLLYKINNT